MSFGRLVRSGSAVFAISFLVAGCGALLSRIQPSQQASQTQEPVAQAQATPATPSSPSSSTNGAAARNRTPYPANVAQNFMNACVQSGGTQESCSCIFSKIQDRYSLQEFSQVEQQAQQTGKMPQEVSDYISTCRPR